MRWLEHVLLGLIMGGAACGVASSGAGAPTNPPASGLGPIVPLEDSAGLSWTAPFLLADPSRALSHPSIAVEGDRMELWAQSDKGGELSIVFARAERFEAGMGSLEEALRAELAWEGGAVGSPAVLRDEATSLLLYVAAGQIGCARLAAGSGGGRGEARAAAPVYRDAGGGLIRSIAFGRVGDHVRGFALVEGPVGAHVDALAGSFAALARAVSAPSAGAPSNAGAGVLGARAAGLVLPGWAVGVIELGVRLEPTPAGRLREDLFFAATLPRLGDLGVDAQPPSAIGAATRYLDGALRDDVGLEPALETVTAPLLSGPPSPTSATAVGYRGGVLILYSARSGPRMAIGVGRHP